MLNTSVKIWNVIGREHVTCFWIIFKEFFHSSTLFPIRSYISPSCIIFSLVRQVLLFFGHIYILRSYVNELKCHMWILISVLREYTLITQCNYFVWKLTSPWPIYQHRWQYIPILQSHQYIFKSKAKAKDLTSKDFIKRPRGTSRPRPWPRGLHYW